MTPRFLVIDGYTKAARDELVSAGATMACDQYSAMLKNTFPAAECDILFPSDPGAELPTGTGLAGAWASVASGFRPFAMRRHRLQNHIVQGNWQQRLLSNRSHYWP